MKFNGEIWMKIPVTQKQKGEPDEFVIIKNPKSAGGLIPYARYGNDWTTTVPNRPLIRELAIALEKETVTEMFCECCKGKRKITRLAHCGRCGQQYDKSKICSSDLTKIGSSDSRNMEF